MDKQIADKKIYEYRDRIFGYALEKTHNIDQAAELASDIVYEVYRSFLNADTIANFDGYVYRIARNVWARYLYRLQTGRRFESTEDLYSLEIASSEDSDPDRALERKKEREEEEETLALLRREIGYLSERQRLVIYLHYYDKLPVERIARRLNISPGTVKWHLSDARGRLKEGMEMSRNMEIREQDLELNPVRFFDMGHSGIPGTTGDTRDMFDTRLKQNIAWACYREPKTLEEIARLVGVPQVYVADNLFKLVDYGYIDRLDNSRNPKYRTNMILTDTRMAPEILTGDCAEHGGSDSGNSNGNSNKDATNHNNDGDKEKTGTRTEPEKRRSWGEVEEEIYDFAAEKLCEKYLPEILDDFVNDPEHWGLSCDGDDLNFLKYNAVLIAVLALGYGIDREKFEQYDKENRKFYIKRPDGGEFAAFAWVTDDTCKGSAGKDEKRGKEIEESPYWCNGIMTRTDHCLSHEECKAHPKEAFEAVSIDCRFTDRTGGWEDNRFTDWRSLVKFLHHGRESLAPEEYKRLCDKGYLFEDRVQPAVFRKVLQAGETLSASPARFLLERIRIPDEIVKLSKEMDEKKFNLRKELYPEHVWPAVRYLWCTRSIANPEMAPRIIEKLLKKGELKPLTEVQRKAVLSILCVQK